MSSPKDGDSCLLVDDLLGKQEVVIKSLGETFKNVSGLSRAARCSGDGRVGLILDVDGILQREALLNPARWIIMRRLSMRPNDFEQIRRMVYDFCGVDLTGKQVLVGTRLGKKVRDLGFPFRSSAIARR